MQDPANSAMFQGYQPQKEKVPLLRPWLEEQDGHRANPWTLVFSFVKHTLLHSLIFMVVSISYMIGYHSIPRILLAASIFVVCALLVDAFLIFLVKGRLTRATLGFAVVAFAFMAGAVVGTHLALTDLVDYWPFELRRHYTNVAPDEPAAAHSDASVLVFMEGARPDPSRVMGYMRQGHRYCVAPITLEAGYTDDQQQPAIQYWAVGKDCCMGSAGFTCDAANDPEARAGLVKMEKKAQETFVETIMSSNEIDFYEKAVSMTMSKFDLSSPKERLFVRFVKDIEAARSEYWAAAWYAWGLHQMSWLIVWMIVGVLSIFIGAGDPEDSARYNDHLDEAKVHVVAHLNHYF